MTDTKNNLKIEPLRAFQDNYIWLLTRAGSSAACVVDPGDAAPVHRALADRGLVLESILLTHHHADHTGGVMELLRDYKPQVFGPANSQTQGISTPLREGNTAQVLGCSFQVLEVPGHTLDHIAYFSDTTGGAPVLFCGDTLFAGGCGRLFEGTAGQMYESLQKLAGLPELTRVYCAHEYTMANLRFAQAAEPENEAIKQRIEDDTRRLKEDQITLPATILTELRTNPFLRCHTDRLKRNVTVMQHVNVDDEVEVFAAVRRWKDEFR